jgi:hypothetical protein
MSALKNLLASGSTELPDSTDRLACPLCARCFRRSTMAWHDELCDRSMEEGITFENVPGRRTVSALWFMLLNSFLEHW